jgi:23S rRNA pseudouridine1911/1915/1917 synthase
MPVYEHKITFEQQGMRIDALLASLQGVSSRTEAVRLIEGGEVLLNGSQITAKKRIVVAEDTVTYNITTQAPRDLAGEQIPLDIRFEDDDLIVLSKQPGLVVHPSPGHENGTLVNALIAHCGYDCLAQLQGDDRPGIVHRLDKDTSGLMLVAKSERAGEALQNAIRTRNVDRRYLTLVHGYIAPETGLVDAPIARSEAGKNKMVVSDNLNARDSVTTFKVLQRYEAGTYDDGYTYIECKLYTGRTHQIRVHMNYIGHPCVGDPLYGHYKPKAQLSLERQFLHSWNLEFVHPISQEALTFQDPIPADLADTLTSIQSRLI